MKHNNRLRALGLAVCLALQLLLPSCGHADWKEATGGNLFAPETDLTEEEEIGARRAALNAELFRRGIEVSEAQFEALLSFCGDFGTSWLSGTSALARIVRDGEEATRLETARAFGVWCHVGGQVDPELAQRRLDEAALWLDGNTAAATKEFAFLGIAHDKDVQYITDYAIYEIGAAYESFPLMVRLGYAIDGYRTAGGAEIRAGDTVRASALVYPNWVKNVYTKRSFPDVEEGRWFYDYVMELSEADIVNGRSDGTFAPGLSVTAGEALKLVLLAAGHPEQEKADGHWAGGYARYAIERGYLKAEALEYLDGPISRRDVAQLAALALGFSQSKEIAPFADTQDGYVTALYEIGVLTGARDEQGELKYYPGSEITRAELSTIVWRLRNAIVFGKTQTLTHKTSKASYSLEKLQIPRYSYLRDNFSGEGRTMSYEESGVTVRRGMDVSRFQGEIDWAAVAADGIEFAMLRVGGRYFESGGFYDDSEFAANLAGARETGVDVGVYFFSQAITPAEAVEEAEFVLDRLNGFTPEMPVVFDWELTGNSKARTNGVSSKTVTDCAVAFCERIREAGLRPMVYFTKYQGYVKYDLSRLEAYDFWYADDYESDMPRFFYDFQMWQYSTYGSVAGIEGRVDLDLWFERE